MPQASLDGGRSSKTTDGRNSGSGSGDGHLMNFGAFATPEDNILFDVNDFDETIPGVDFTVDLERLATGVAVAALASGETKKRARALAAAIVAAYRA